MGETEIKIGRVKYLVHEKIIMVEILGNKRTGVKIYYGETDITKGAACHSCYLAEECLGNDLLYRSSLPYSSLCLKILKSPLLVRVASENGLDLKALVQVESPC